MKKLMLTAVASAALAFGAKAGMPDDAIPSNAQNLETTDYGVRYDYQEGETIYTVDIYTKTGESLWQVQDGVTSFDFLVVGGGGGGRSSGGGAGGVVTGFVNQVDSEYAVLVGEGGAAGGTDGKDSVFGVRDGDDSLVDWVRAYGGGGGVGGKTAGKSGGCGSGAGTKGNTAGAATQGAYDAEKVAFAKKFGCAGGSSNVDYGSAGGGGATQAGTKGSNSSGNKGGDGLQCAISGVALWYAGGGTGGGNNHNASENPGGLGGGGRGGVNADKADKSQLPYYRAGGNGVDGLGGGGGGVYTDSAYGKGGSGVVIIRYAYKTASSLPVAMPSIASKAYTGETLTADIDETDEYEVVENNGGINPGTYPVVLRLKAHDPKYVWDDGEKSEGDKTLDFVISKAANRWTTEPSLSKTAWELDEDPATVNAVAALSETAVVVTYDEGVTEMPLALGSHTAVFTVEESQNYLGIEKTIGYTISKNANVWVTEPGLTKTTWAFNEEPGAVVDGEAKYGDVVVTYDDNPEITKLPTDKGSHTVKFAVAGTDTYTDLEKVVNYTVTKKQHKWTEPPNVPATVNIEDGANFPMPVAEPGVEVKAYFDGNPEKTELTGIALGETHTVTYAIAGDDDWDEVEQTFTFKGVYKAIVDPVNPSKVFGYRIPKLGMNQDEVALVFTNTSAAMTYNLPSAVSTVSYLVVGGGGGGGGWVSAYACGGGGAGGVVSNSDVAVSGGSISVDVGKGGAGCTSGSHNSTSGMASQLVLGDQPAVIAYGGGKGGCAAAGVGGEGYGSGGGGGSTRVSGSYVSLAGGVANPDGQGHAGGDGTSGTYRGGGGGGAGEDGWTPTSEKSGKGGDGIVSDITGDDVWYAGGGGGGSHDNGGIASPGGKGGGGAGGTCKSNQHAAGRDATYFGGGGGSAKGDANGGSGYQGVVIVRYVEPAGVVMVPTILPKTYTGETLVADVPVNVGYAVTENEGGTDVGDYDVVLTLNDGYHWDGGSTEPTNLTFTITRAQNEWTVEPSIDKTTWLTTDDPGELTAGETKFGTPAATIVKDGGDAEPFDGTLPTDPGAYVIAYTVETSENWIDPEVTEKSVGFEIVSGDVVPPFTVTKGEMTTVVGDGKVDLSVGYAVHCEVESDKAVDIYAYIAEDGADTTNEVKIAEGVALDAVGTGTIPDLKPGVTYWVALGGRGGETVAPMTEFTTVTMAGPTTGLTASATFTNNPKEFIITGSVTPGLGTTTVFVRWSLNSGALDQSAVFPFQYGDAGAFTQKVAYVELTDTLTWDVVVSNSFASTTYGDQAWGDALSVSTKKRADSATTIYKWTGAGGNNDWANPGNWSANNAECFGYPDNVNYAIAQITQTVAINLGGGAYSLVKGGSIWMDANSGDVVTLTNGTIKMAIGDKDTELGAAGTTLVFRDVRFERARLNPVAGATVVVEGVSTFTGMIRPKASKIKIILRNSENITIGDIFNSNSPDGITGVTVSNALVTVENATMPSATWQPATFPVTLQNGPDRQARLIFRNTQYDNRNMWDFVQSPYALTIPERPYETPYLQTAKPAGVSASKPIFKIDVTNWKRSKRVPILTFTSSASGAETQYGGATVKAYENGVDVTAKRNAQLIWDETTKTLYYKQDSQVGFALIVK